MNSLHNQGINQLAPGLFAWRASRRTARSRRCTCRDRRRTGAGLRCRRAVASGIRLADRYRLPAGSSRNSAPPCTPMPTTAASAACRPPPTDERRFRQRRARSALVIAPVSTDVTAATGPQRSGFPTTSRIGQLHVHRDRRHTQSRHPEVPARPRRDGRRHGRLRFADLGRAQPAGHRAVRAARRRARVPRRRLHHRHQDRRHRLAGTEAAGARRHHGAFRRRPPGDRGQRRRRPRRGDRSRRRGDRRPDQGAARHARPPGGGRRRRRHRVPRLSRGRRAAAHAGLVLRLPVLTRHAEARHREHAAALRAGGRRGRAGRSAERWPLGRRCTRLDLLFREARTHNKCTDEPVTDESCGSCTTC